MLAPRSHPARLSFALAATLAALPAAAQAAPVRTSASVLVASTQRLEACLRADHRSGGCTREQAAFAAAASHDAGARSRASVRVSVSDGRLSWSRSGTTGAYVVAASASHHTTTYDLVATNATTPPVVPGATVAYRVLPAAAGASWSAPVTIEYASASRISRRGSSSSALLAAPVITVDGDTLSWPAVAGTNSFVFVRKVPGQADAYSDIAGTSITPPAAPGLTVQYSVRTNVNGSAWASEVSVTYPAATAPAPPNPAPTPSPAPSPGPFEMGVVAGSDLDYELPFIEQLGARTARLEFDIDTPVAEMVPVVQEYAAAGIRPLLLASFYGRVATVAEAQSLAAWAAAFGPGGTAWVGGSYPVGTAVTDIEFGNETNESYQFADTDGVSGFANLPAYTQRAEAYAVSAAAAAEAIRTANPGVGLLAIGDNGGSSGPQWVDDMFAAVPNLGSLVAGWTAHPYGPDWETMMDDVITQTQAAGAPDTVPIYVTEWGLSSDNGRCLDDNYGFDPCMTYSEAASTLQSTLSAMQARYGSRLAAFYLYQAHDQQPTGTSTSREAYFGALQSNGAAKGAYTTAVEEDLAANP